MSEVPHEAPLELARPLPSFPVRGCPSCQQVLGPPKPGVGDQQCGACGFVFLDGDAADQLCQRLQVPVSTMQDVVRSGLRTSHPCASCSTPLANTQLLGQPVEGCASCGALGMTAAAFSAVTGISVASPVSEPPKTDRALIALAIARAAAVVAVCVGVPYATSWAVQQTDVGTALLPTAPATGLAMVMLLVQIGLWPMLIELGRLVDFFAAHPRRQRALVAASCMGPLSVLAKTDLPAGRLLVVGGTLVVLGALALIALRARPAGARSRLVVAAPIGIAIGVTAVLVPLFVVPAARQDRNSACVDGGAWVEHGGRHCQRDGIRHGPGEERDARGVLVARGHWQNGQRDGAFELFHPSGQRAGEGLYSQDLQVGPWIEYTDNGETVAYGTFVSGKKDGVWFIKNGSGFAASAFEAGVRR